MEIRAAQSATPYPGAIQSGISFIARRESDAVDLGKRNAVRVGPDKKTMRGCSLDTQIQGLEGTILWHTRMGYT